MKTITFYSYKGGVGRTLALSNIATRLAEFGKKVCLIDFDLEAPGLPYKFKRFKYEEGKGGLVDYIKHFEDTNSIPAIEGFIHKVNTNKKASPIFLIPAGNNNTKEYWKNLASIDWNKIFYRENSRGVAFFLDLKAKIEKNIKPDFLLVDSRTGITEISGITMSLFADEVVLVGANNDENIEGIKLVIHGLLNPQNQLVKQSPIVDVVLSRIPFSTDPDDKGTEDLIVKRTLRKINKYLKDKLLDYQVNQIFVIHSDPELEIEESLKIGYKPNVSGLINTKDHTAPIAQDYLNLFEKLTSNILTPAEVNKFNNIKESEFLIEHSKAITDTTQAIDLLKKAITLNPNSIEAMLTLANRLMYQKKYEDAIGYIDNALQLSPTDLKTLNAKGWNYYYNGKLDEAEELFKQMLNIDSVHYGALIGMAGLMRKRNKLEQSLTFLKKVIEVYPEDWVPYNTIANNLRLMGKYDEALIYTYKAIELNPKAHVAYGTLGEIYSALGNLHEFYKNLELALIFGLDFLDVLKDDIETYRPFLEEERFKRLLDKYNIIIPTPITHEH